MDLATRIFRRTGLLLNLFLGLTLAGLLAVELALVPRPAGSGWLPIGVTVAVGGLALGRERNRAWTVSIALVVCTVAAGASLGTDLPSQPGFTATAALLVLGASYVRTATPGPAAVVVGAGLVLLTASRADLRGPFILPASLLGVIAWGAALGLGLWLRSLDAQRRTVIEAARRDERLELARELHDVVGHHIAVIVVQAQAAGLAAARQPHLLPGALTEIETAGGNALIAMRQVVGLLRATDEGNLGDLVSRFDASGRRVQG